MNNAAKTDILFQEIQKILRTHEGGDSLRKPLLDLFSNLSFVDAVMIRLHKGPLVRRFCTFYSDAFPKMTRSEQSALMSIHKSLGSTPIRYKQESITESIPIGASKFCQRNGFNQALFFSLPCFPDFSQSRGSVAIFSSREKSSEESIDSLVAQALSQLPFSSPALPSDLENLVRFYIALHEINHLIARNPSPDILYGEVCRIAVRYAGLKLAWIAKMDWSAGIARIISSHGPAQAYAEGLTFSTDPSSPLGQGPAGRSLREGRAIVTSIDQDPGYGVWRERAHRFGLHSSASFPFRRGGRVEGLMGVYSEDPKYFSTPLVSLLKRLSDDMEFSLEGYDRSQHINRLQTYIRSILEVTEEISKRPDPDRLFNHVTRQAVEKFGVAFASIILRDPEKGLTLTAHDGPILGIRERIKHVDPPALHSPENFGPINRVLSTGRTVVIPSFLWSPDCFPWRSLIAQEEIKSGAGFPLIVEENVIGLLLVGSIDSSYFTDEVIDLLENMVENLSFAIRDVHRRKRLEYLGLHDDLTGLPNRAAFLETLQSYLSQPISFSVAILDIDNFKEINDSLGHAAGDRVLLETACRLQEIIAPGDVLARLGGDEFALILLDRNDFGSLESFWDNLSHTLERPLNIESYESGILSLTASIGVATSVPNISTSSDLLRQADQALYFSKENGRNTWSLYSPSLNERLEKTFGIRRAFKTGLAEGEMSLFIQPQIDLQTGQVSGAEALVRWMDHRSGDVRLPEYFLPVVERDLSQISLLGEWVLDEAYRFLGLPGMENEHLSINIGALHFLNKNFLAHVDSCHLKNPEIGHRLTIEITEAVALSHLDVSAKTIQALSERGISISLDDFGTGFGSLSYLNSLPVKEIKLDQSFIRNMTFRPGDFAIVSGAMLTAALRRIQVVAEGLEHLETGLELLRIGCHYAQGFGIARPMPFQEFSKWKKSWNPPEIWKKGRHAYFLYRGVDLLLAQVELRGLIYDISDRPIRDRVENQKASAISSFIKRIQGWLSECILHPAVLR